jgi:nucleotide-binding universal stress UspA family protein
MAAVDLGAEDSQRVVREAAALARSLRRPLHLIHVLEPLPEEALILPIIPDIQEKRRQQAMTRLHSFKKAHAPEAVVLLNEGPAWQEIIRMAAEHAVTLVITGCGAEGGVLAKLIGSTAERVVRHAPCPVLVLRGDEGQMLAGGGPLLLCTDRSEASCAAFYHAVAFSTLLAAPLLLACVEEPLALPGTLEYQRFHPEIDAEREAADTALDCFRAAHLPSSMDVRPCVVEGTPHRALCRLAAREQARMVIAARHGLHGWRKALIGSTTERLVRHAPCAVLVVPARCAAHDADGASLA